MGDDRPEFERLNDEILVLRQENERLAQQLAERTSAPGDSEFLSALLKALPTFIARLDPDLKMRFLNRLAPGFSAEDIMGASIFDFIDPAHHEAALGAIERVRQQGGVERYQAEALGPHGRPAHYETIVAPITEADGRMGFVLISLDITEQTERARTLASKEEQLRLAVAATGIGLWSYDLTTGEVEWSERMREIMGRNEPLAPDKYETEAVHPEDRELVATSTRKVIDGDETAWARHRVVLPDGSVRWLIPTGKITRDERGRAVRLTGGNLDITAIHDLENRLKQAEKMEALGTLTTGVAHNLNNLLAVIQPTLDLLDSHVDSEGHELLHDAMQATSRAATVVRQLMAFAGKRRAVRTRIVNLGRLVADAVSLSRRSLSSSIELDFVNEAPGSLVDCDPDELSEVVTNLVFNARDALEQASIRDGRIEVRVQSGEPSTLAGSVRASLHSSDAVRVTVTDNGPGMSETVCRRVFDPFFTTKGPQAGTGLGLSISWSAVRGMGGSMRCESAPGEGAKFSVDLPRLKVEEEQQVRGVEPRASSRTLRVLLVDDDDAVRRAIRLALSWGNHTVSEAGSGAQALEIAGRENIDAILLDQSLPDCLGTEIVSELRRRASGAKILLFTGQDVEDRSALGVDGVLNKPLGSNALLEALARLTTSG